MCAANPYVRGKEILVFSGPYPDGLVDGDCGSSLPAEGVAESLPFVRSYFADGMKSKLYGKVAANTELFAMHSLLFPHRGSPFEGATVVAETAKGEQFRAFTNSAGQYEMSGVPSGGIVLRAEKPGYVFRPERPLPVEVTMPVSGCVQQDLALWSSNSVRGSVYGRYGKPMAGIRVMAVDKTTGRAVSGREKTDREGRFEIRRIAPAQEVIVVASPDGPTENSPYPPAEQEGAPLQIGLESMISNVVVRLKPAELMRDIHVRVLRADGRVVTTGYVDCEDANKTPNGPRIGARIAANGAATCHVAASRRISVQPVWIDFPMTLLVNAPSEVVAPGFGFAEVVVRLP